MHLYQVKVNLNGNSDHQVILDGVTAAEIRLLQYIHGKSENGKEPVVDIVHTANTTRTDRQERQRLQAKYMELSDNGVLGQGAAVITRLFGVPGVPLPHAYEAPIIVPEDDLPTEEAPIDEVVTAVEPEKISDSKPKIKRTVVPAKEAAMSAVA